jgi:hypothetical protein
MNEEVNKNVSKIDLESKIRNFNDLLQTIDSLNDKKKRLWSEIYENAIKDRQISYTMFTKLSNIAEEKSTEHAIHGRTMSSYIERMSKANDQLIKLSELVAKAEQKDEEIDSEDLFSKISN